MLDLLELKLWHQSQRERSGIGNRKPVADLAVPGTAELQEDAGAKYIPTPETIHLCCQEIQQGWSTAERRRRGALGEPCPAEGIPIHRLWQPRRGEASCSGG